MITLPPMPFRIEKLPRDERGYPVPWFVAWVDGKPEFRAVATGRAMQAVRENLCWVCGEPFAPNVADDPLTFVIGPMCSVNRLSAEPPSHYECALFSVKACPFLTMPKAHRREANLPKGLHDGAGVMLLRNPGVTILWVCERYKLVREPKGVLFRLAEPLRTEWYTEGRLATREECQEAMDSGLPTLKSLCSSPDDHTALAAAATAALKFLPA